MESDDVGFKKCSIRFGNRERRSDTTAPRPGVHNRAALCLHANQLELLTICCPDASDS